MSKIQIIYTPETNHFRLDDIQIIDSRQPGDPLVSKLRNNYQQLREVVPNLPLEIGIATDYWLFKREANKGLAKFRDNKSNTTSTTYLALDVMENVLKLRSNDFSDQINHEFAYRRLMYLMSNGSITGDEDLKNKMFKTIMLATVIPFMEGNLPVIQENFRKLREQCNLECISEIEKSFATLKDIYPTFDDLQKMHDYILEKFNANQVSRDFPLYFHPSDSLLPSIYSVSLKDEIETPDYLPKLLEVLEAGAKAQGLNAIPEDVRKVVMVGQKDKFGQTRRISTSLDEWLSALPEPKTIITDIYIVDRFPELKQIEFETKEFKLN